jgi:hypothetical protein
MTSQSAGGRYGDVISAGFDGFETETVADSECPGVVSQLNKTAAVLGDEGVYTCQGHGHSRPSAHSPAYRLHVVAVSSTYRLCIRPNTILGRNRLAKRN